jgi:hypothetical protein
MEFLYALYFSSFQCNLRNIKKNLGRQGRHGINDCTNVAHSVLVSKIAQLFKLSSCSTFSLRSIKAFTQQRISCNEQKKVVSSRLLCIGKSLKNQGASKFAREIIDMYHSWRSSTSKQYEFQWKK